MEQTLIVVKPDGVVRALSGEIIARFEKAGLKLVAARMVTVTKELADRHYPADRTELWKGIGNKTLEHYREVEEDARQLLGTDDPHEIGKLARVWLLDYITSGPVLAAVFEGPHAVELVRKIVGHTLPLKSAPGTIRGDYSFDSSFLANTAKRAIKNLIHASGTVDEAQYEIPLWFKKEDIVDYTRSDHQIMG